MIAALGIGLLLSLAACGSKVATNNATYRQDGMVAVVKGTASGHSRVHYQAKTASGSVKVNDSHYVISLPTTTTDQTVKITAGSDSTTTKVKAAKALGDYKTIAGKYNQAVIATALPKSVQKQLQKAQQTKVDPSKMTPQQQQAMAQQQKTLQAEMAKAKQATKASQLPGSASGLKQVLKTDGATIRMNVQSGKLIGATDVVSVKALKDKKQQQAFAMQFGLLANAVGADAKKVGSDFQKATKNKKSSSTTINTIVSHGIKFDVGISTTNLFIYITK